MLDAVRYVTDNEVKWRAFPADFPAWDRACAFFCRWRTKGLAQEFHARLREKARQAEGRQAQPTAAVIDSQSVKAAASVPGVSARSSSARTRAAASRSSNSPITDGTGHLRITENELIARNLRRRRQNHA